MNMRHVVLLVLFFGVLQADQKYRGEQLFVHNLSQYVQVPQNMLKDLYNLATPIEHEFNFWSKGIKRALFRQYPSLRDKIPHLVLGTLPTPIERLEKLGAEIGCNQFYIKRDDKTSLILEDGSCLFGGNKIRKLEFLMADALLNGARSVMTFGMAGSNHVVATVACANHLGMKSYAILRPQPNSHVLQRNLSLMDYYGAQIHYCINKDVRALASTYLFFKEKADQGTMPYFIPTGGSCPVGVLGYVSAAFELKEQIKKGLLPEPQYIYVAAGSFGTISGLLLGVKLAGLKSKIIGIAIEPEETIGEFKDAIVKLFNETSALLHEKDAKIPLHTITLNEIDLLYEFGGTEYGLYTCEGIQAKKLFGEKENIILDGTYTGKAVSGMLVDLKKRVQSTDVILYWHTFYSNECQEIVINTNRAHVPKVVREYFETEVQPLDK